MNLLINLSNGLIYFYSRRCLPDTPYTLLPLILTLARSFLRALFTAGDAIHLVPGKFASVNLKHSFFFFFFLSSPRLLRRTAGVNLDATSIYTYIGIRRGNYA